MPLIQGIRISELTPKAVPSADDLFVMAKTLDTNYKITFAELDEALQKLTTQGDILTHDGSDPVRLPVGTTGQVLKTNGTSVSWEDFGSYIPDIGNGDRQLIVHYDSGYEVVPAGENGQVLKIINDTVSWQDEELYQSPLTTNGDLLSYNGSQHIRLGVGSEGEFLRVSSGIPSWETVNLFEDPLTTDGDIVVRASGETTRLPIGSNGQVLGISSGSVSWVDLDNYSDPLTTQGDILTHNGDESIRLPVGSNGQVLTVVNGNVSWQTPVDESLTDPTINTGDIIYRSGGSLTRRGIGNEGQVLAVASGVPQWITVPGISDVDNYFRTISVSGQDDIVASGESDSLTLVAGTGITLTTDDVAKSVTITGSNTINVEGTRRIPYSDGNQNFDYTIDFTYNEATSVLTAARVILDGGSDPGASFVSGTSTATFGFNNANSRFEVNEGGRTLLYTTGSSSNLFLDENATVNGTLNTTSSATIGNALSVTGSLSFVNGTINLPNNPTTSTTGALRFNTSTNKLQTYHSGQWNDVDSTSTVDTNDYVDSLSFNTSNGILTAGRTGSLSNLTVDLDGRWLQIPSLLDDNYPKWDFINSRFANGNIRDSGDETLIRDHVYIKDRVVRFGDINDVQGTHTPTNAFMFGSSLTINKPSISAFTVFGSAVVNSNHSGSAVSINSSTATFNAPSSFGHQSATAIDCTDVTITNRLTAIRVRNSVLGATGSENSYDGYVYVGKLAIADVDSLTTTADNTFVGYLGIRNDDKVVKITPAQVNSELVPSHVIEQHGANFTTQPNNEVRIKKALYAGRWLDQGNQVSDEVILNIGSLFGITSIDQVLSVDVSTSTSNNRVSGNLFNNADEHVWWEGYTSGTNQLIRIRREGSSFQNTPHDLGVLRVMITYYTPI